MSKMNVRSSVIESTTAEEMRLYTSTPLFVNDAYHGHSADELMIFIVMKPKPIAAIVVLNNPAGIPTVDVPRGSVHTADPAGTSGYTRASGEVRRTRPSINVRL